MSVGFKGSDASQLYRFKDIQTVPGAMDLVDIVLSATQRRTPTVVHPQYDISRIRSFYMRKVKHCQQEYHDKFSAILSQFPKIDDIHPFYADLCNVLYDKDHYKIALGQVNAVRNSVDQMAKEYVRLLKYADSSYKCKMLKRAALGRMCTIVKKLKNSLAYLEEVRRHLGRLPGINPFSRSVLLAGFPNVGKSTFMNVLSNANVETANWSFTTQSLYVGHFDYKYQPWQVIDTPGVLDRPLSSRNTIELCAITAMAHLSCAVLFLVDISEHCGHTVADQVKLFHSLRPLLQHKPVVVVLNKIDLRGVDSLTAQEQEMIKSMGEGFDLIHFVACSTLEKLNLDEAKNKACEMLLSLKVQKRLMAGKTAYNTLDELYVTNVTPLAERPPIGAPPTRGDLAARDEMGDEKLLEKDLMEVEGGAGVYNADTRKHWQLEDESWKYDEVPEILNGKNVADFVDPEIDAKLRALEEEEAELERTWDKDVQAPTQDWYDAQAALREITIERETRRLMSRIKNSNNQRTQARQYMDTEAFKQRLAPMGIDPEEILERLTKYEKETTTIRARRQLFKPDRKTAVYGTNVERKVELEKDIHRVNKRYTKPKKSQPKDQINEADRFIGAKRPKHLFSGKRTIGKTDRR
ncbi:nucleolar GTP-binding protein 1 [Gregarina niphandrodes]|uniref:Nucleolar GTP-binding protein 1 n=1 Tax=Gregarina niphandrodes TaxID=110365 RepID=A0A023AYG7_GRENI|nr:nucleolar GTP-binding protein 1 [Gregarina niphandrodes]EZG43717.1 nucleolar GTP-binding protein 1 [Gregarina niphandrodes]|eukprot:XP_011133047.1 nucleolar GTP-binding protein 1 [Gregarina niphandrodes]